MDKTRHTFGGDWTSEKLERVRKYLKAYATIMNQKNFRFAYIDAFAGTGYRTTKAEDSPLLTGLGDSEPQGFLDGSARIALAVEPAFHRYIFIEKSLARFKELERLKNEFPSRAGSIMLVHGEANACILDLCGKSWRKHRAVLFLDPYGMQVRWETIKAIANTKAIDLWLLFPLGVAVNRLLPKRGKIYQSWRNRLDEMFGTKDWYDEFYRIKTDANLFGNESSTEKTGNIDSIAEYFVNRLKTVFAGVAENPLPLVNSRNSPLYLLCFAAANPAGVAPAIKIAQDILRK